MTTSTLPRLPHTSLHASDDEAVPELSLHEERLPRLLPEMPPVDDWRADHPLRDDTPTPGKRSEAIAIPVLPGEMQLIAPHVGGLAAMPSSGEHDIPMRVSELAGMGSASDLPEIDLEQPTEVIDHLPLPAGTLVKPSYLPGIPQPYRTGSAIAPNLDTPPSPAKPDAATSKKAAVPREVPEQRIQADLTLATDLLKSIFGRRLDGICLVGSFGRGEETLRLLDGAWEPDDDYDLLLIFNREANHEGVAQRIARDVLPRLNERSLVRFDVKWLHPATVGRLGSLTRYDLTRVYKYIEGDSHLLASMVKGRDLELDRDAGLDRVLYRTARFFHAYAEAVDLTYGETAVCIAAQHALHQVVLAVGDSMLIDAGAYTPKLARRQQRIRCHFDSEVPGLDWWHRRFLTVSEARLEGYRGIPDRERLEEGFLQISMPLSDYLTHAVNHLDARNPEIMRRSTSSHRRKSTPISRTTNRITAKLGISRDMRAERVDLAHRMARILRACQTRDHLQHLGPTARALYESWVRMGINP